MKIAHNYDDIIHLSRPDSGRRARMSNYDRAAQFSPFAALTGFDAAIAETGRLTSDRIELDEGCWINRCRRFWKSYPTSQR